MPGVPLSEAIIVDEALRLLNERGLKEVSLRNIAARLNVKAPSLARHVGDKGTLLARMSDTIFLSCLTAMPRCETWQEWLFEFGRSLWTAQRNVRDAPRLIVAARYDPNRIDRLVTVLSGKLGALGVADELQVPMQSSVQALVTGWSSLAEPPKNAVLERLMPIEEVVLTTLRRLIDGWSLAVTDGEPGAALRAGSAIMPTDRVTPA